MGQNIIILDGPIDDKMFFYVSEAIWRLIARGAPPITIVIASEGGDIDLAMQLFDLIQMYPGDTVGIVYGWAKSGAAIILQACDRRLATSASFIRMHEISSNGLTLETMRDTKKIEAVLRKFQDLQDDIYEIFAVRAKKSADEIKKIMLADAMMTAKTALELGLIDGIATELPAIPHPYSR